MKTYAPIFSGFYETEFAMNMDNYEVIQDMHNDFDDFNDNEKLLIDTFIINNFDKCIDTDYKGYETEVAHKVCEYLSNEVSLMLHTEVKFEFENIYSPQYYNFKNDSINVNLVCDTDVFMKKLLGFIQCNIEAFKQYIEDNYTSCDGFISYYSNDVNDWIKKEYNDHEIGSMLEFALRLWNKDIYCNMVYYVIENVWEGAYYSLKDDFEAILNDIKPITKEFDRLCNQKNEYINDMKSKGKKINYNAITMQEKRVTDEFCNEILALMD